ncbi:hypothetical protein PR048_000492 [Dryococelus australis]|uniref:DDE-1 domain-containing protein n=1 Tax=Dryococelus australis TaxID=614101 RepID=A0ABQ9IES1_9NEOP|nr:hypothetical protein PR048_000492 [Dryococelus australis]
MRAEEVVHHSPATMMLYCIPLLEYVPQQAADLRSPLLPVPLLAGRHIQSYNSFARQSGRDLVKKKLCVCDLAMRFAVGKMQIANILINKDEILQLWTENSSSSSIRAFPKIAGVAVGTMMYECFDRIRRHKRKVILFMDNADPHPDVKLTYVIIFLPPNVTTACQPPDQGIMDVTSAVDLAKTISALGAILWANSAIQKIMPPTVRTCFMKAGNPLATGFTGFDAESVNDSDSKLTELLTR